MRTGNTITLMVTACAVLLWAGASPGLHAGTRAGESLYIAPGTHERLAGVDAILADTPDIQFGAASAFRAARQDDMQAILGPLRSDLEARFAQGGIRLASAPGAGVLQVRLAITDLVLVKKKRPLLAYTPVGALLKAGVDARKDIASKYDISSVTLKAEVTDSQTKDLLVRLETAHGAANGDPKLDFEGLDSLVGSLTTRLLCQLERARPSMMHGNSCG